MHSAVPSTSRNRAVNVVSGPRSCDAAPRRGADVGAGAHAEHERRVGPEADVHPSGAGVDARDVVPHGDDDA